MSSSTSPSKYLFATLIGSLVVSFLAGAAFTLWINPEIQFWKEAYSVKIAHAKELDATGKPKVVFFGGSSCAFQIIPEILEREFNIPSVNMGMHAGMGARVITALALQVVKPGDTLIMNMEPGLLAREDKITPLGLQFIVATGNINTLRSLSSSATITFLDMVLSLRPGLQNIVTMTGKLLIGSPLYRYSKKDIQKGGFLTTNVKGAKAIEVKKAVDIELPPDSETFLREFSFLTSSNHIAAYYLLPWSCTSTLSLNRARKSYQTFATEVGKFIPQIKDGFDGADDHEEEFADTANHTKRAGAKRRTEIVSKVMESNNIK